MMEQILPGNASELDNNVEVITDEEVNNDIISIDQLISETEQKEQIGLQNQVKPVQNQVKPVQITPEVSQENQLVQKEEIIPKKKDKVLMVQITLIIIWAILTALVYFFGYDLFEPFIRV